ncbi:MAG TPA: hypothetical protein VF824_19105 [Thermoanaerobaculia bacterium]|jgi:hypothetical protein
MSRRIAVFLLLLLSGCVRPPVSDEVTIDLRGEHAVVTARTRFSLQPGNEESRARIEAARAAALDGSDPWSVRFARVNAESERVTFERTRGALENVIHEVEIAPEELQRVFADANVTVNVLHGDGWRELTFYPGSGGRATREQQRHFDAELSSWSKDVARYFTAVDHLYTYLDDQPGRAEYVFAAVLGEKDAAVLDEEQPLVDAVVDSMTAIADRMDANEGRAESFAEEADLVFNPLPARVVVRVPGDVVSSEGFASKEGALTIEPVDLFGAIGKLEGRWISPDPLAALLRDQAPTAAQLADAERVSHAVVNASEVAAALRDQLARPKVFAVRWRD